MESWRTGIVPIWVTCPISRMTSDHIFSRIGIQITSETISLAIITSGTLRLVTIDRYSQLSGNKLNLDQIHRLNVELILSIAAMHKRGGGIGGLSPRLKN